jgi:cadmium resistance protein CadD (predicted permease)
MELLSSIGLAIVVFVSTNIDDILLLVALFADSKIRYKNVVIGQYIGIGALFLVSAIAGFASVLVPPGWTSLLGIVPLGLGVYSLFGSKTSDEEDFQTDEHELEKSFHSQVLAISGLTIANGGDNLSVYIPLFAKDPSQISLYGIVFAILIIVWCFVGYALVNNRWIGRYIQKYGKQALPFVLIALGIYILYGARVIFGIN